MFNLLLFFSVIRLEWSTWKKVRNEMPEMRGQK